MKPALAHRRATVTEYLHQEVHSAEKHEYRDGRIVDMAGGSADHSLIVTNVLGELRHRLKGKPCQVYDSNLRIKIARTILYTYPDASIICGERIPDPRDPLGHTMTNPRAIVEVLSPTSEAYDRGDKFDRYRKIESLREYILVSQMSPLIEGFYRRNNGTWLLSFTAGLKSSARLRSVGVDLPLGEVYAGVRFVEAAE